MFQIKKVILERHIILSSIAFFLSLLLPSISFAATITGKVTDKQTTQAISDVKVKVMSPTGSTLASVLTNASGEYNISGTFGGLILLSLEKSGYKSQTRSRVLSGDSPALTEDFQLEKAPVNSTPVISSFLPSNRTKLIAGDSLTVNVTASDADKDTLYYRYYLDFNVIQNWTTASSYTYTTGSKDEGRHTVKVEVKDNHGGLASQSAEVYVYFYAPKM